ncbi:MAG: DUF1385 domain-containing protein [Armatimonadetes bacterium]|nr:DUF1385 domain-containing protein [Armatimonadota bacterium]
MKENFQYGGQAVIEGVMMRSPRFFAVACRRTDDEEIEIRQEAITSVFHRFKWLNKPFLRGTLALFEAMALGMKSLSFSASVAMDAELRKEAAEKANSSRQGKETPASENSGIKLFIFMAIGAGLSIGVWKVIPLILSRWLQTPGSLNIAAWSAALLVFIAWCGLLWLLNRPPKEKTIPSDEPPKSISEIAVGATMVVGLALGVGLFVVLPNAMAGILGRWFTNPISLNLAEGVLRLLIFIGYVGAISLMKDIQRVFQYHGAEHKVINTFEANQPLTLENALKQTRIHPRCGTSFILIVLLISIIVFSFLGWPAWYWRILSRLLLLPVIAGISYEIIRLAGRQKDAAWTRILLAPGLWSQYITTREPSNGQVEVAMKALQAVLDKENQSSEMALVP